VRQVPAEFGVIVAGDLNSKSFEWGLSVEDDRGKLLAETMLGLGFWPANEGHQPTFERADSQSVIDVTFSRLPHNSFITS